MRWKVPISPSPVQWKNHKLASSAICPICPFLFERSYPSSPFGSKNPHLGGNLHRALWFHHFAETMVRWRCECVGNVDVWCIGLLDFCLLPKHPKKGSIKLDAFQIVATQKQEPSLCGSSFSGFLFNRRKEVWLYDLVAKSCKFTVMNKDLFLKIDRYGCHWLPWTATRMASWEGSQAELEFEDSNRARLSRLSDGFNEMI